MREKIFLKCKCVAQLINAAYEANLLDSPICLFIAFILRNLEMLRTFAKAHAHIFY